MEEWKEIFADMLSNGEMEIRFPQAPNLEKCFADKCYFALCEIKEILETAAYSDKECFIRIEEVLRVYEKMGIRCGNRHDF